MSKTTVIYVSKPAAAAAAGADVTDITEPRVVHDAKTFPNRIEMGNK